MRPIVVRNVKIGKGMPKICAPIVEMTDEDILQAAHEVCETSADLVEWRVDWYEFAFDIDRVKSLAKQIRNVLGEIPLLFTFRTKREGGEKEISFEKYMELTKEIANTSYVDMIDLEVFFDEKIPELVTDLQKRGIKVIGSNHDFLGTPDKGEIIQRLCHMQEIGVDIPKIAVMPQNSKDVMTLLSATQEMVSDYANRPIATMSMSGMGAVSRVAGEVFGSAITFGAMKKTSAPGQIGVEELKKILEVLHQDVRQ